MPPNDVSPDDGRNRDTGLGYALVIPLLLAEWLSAGRNPRMICDAELKVLWHCPRLPEWIEKAGSVRLERECLVLIDKRVQSAIRDFLGDPDRSTAAIGFEDEALGQRLVLQCQRLEVPRFRTTVGMRILSDTDELGNGFLYSQENLGLTRKEAEICDMLLRGKTVQDIVETTGRSPDTVRSHVRNIYLKTGTSSREALFARLRPYIFD